MSNDLTDQLPDGPSMRDILLQMLERMGRVEAALGIGEADTQPLSGRVNRLLVELAEFEQETRDALEDMDRSIAGIQRDDARRWARLDERVQRLEHPEEAKP